MSDKKLGPSFPDEYSAAGLVGSPLVVNTDDGTFIRNGATDAQVVKLQAVIAANDPNGSLAWRQNQAVAALRIARDAAMNGGMSYVINGKSYVFQTDLTSRVLVNGSAQAIGSSATPPTGYYLRTNDTPNVNVPVTADQMQAFQVALTNQASAIRVLYNQFKAQILASNNPESVTYSFATLSGVSDGTILPTPAMNIPTTVVATASTAASASTTATQAANVAATANSTASAAMSKANTATASATDAAGIAAAAKTAADAATAKAATAVQPGDLATVAKTGKFADLTGLPIIMSTTVNATTFIGTIALTGYAKPPQVMPVASWNGNQLYLPEIVSVTATLITLKAHRSKGTLLLSDGPFENAPSISVSVLVSA